MLPIQMLSRGPFKMRRTIFALIAASMALPFSLAALASGNPSERSLFAGKWSSDNDCSSSGNVWTFYEGGSFVYDTMSILGEWDYDGAKLSLKYILGQKQVNGTISLTREGDTWRSRSDDGTVITWLSCGTAKLRSHDEWERDQRRQKAN